jgi:hypothetical protein
MCRFDGRALLDFIRPYDPRLRPPREKTEEELELDELCNYERYKDVIKQRRKGCKLSGPAQRSGSWFVHMTKLVD